MPLSAQVAFSALFALGGCNRGDSGAPAPAPSSKTATAVDAAVSGERSPAPVPKASAAPAASVEPVYTGPTGTVRGFVSVTGDAAPLTAKASADIPNKCPRAREMYGRVFREGMMRSLADVLVAVTGYKGRLEAKSQFVSVEAKDCTWGTRTLGMALGQTLKVSSKDTLTHVPRLVGADTGAELVVLPGGDPVPLRPTKPGRFTLVDSMNLFIQADVFVLQYPTFAVTGLDGRYEVSGIPPGEVEVSAVLPATMAAAGKKVVVSAGETALVNLEIAFDAKAYQRAVEKAGAPKPGASGAPAAASAGGVSAVPSR